MGFPDIKWQEITGIVGYKCRGGPMHGKWVESLNNKAPIKVNWVKRGVPYIEHYYCVRNYDNNRDEYVWGLILDKKKKKWAKKREIEQICKKIEHLAWNNPQIKEHTLDIIDRVKQL